MSDTRELRSDRLVLQPVSMSDVGALLAHWTGRLVRSLLFGDVRLTSGQVAEVITASQRDFAHAGFGLWGLRPAARHTAVDSSLLGTALLGTAGLVAAGSDGEVEIVYSVEPRRWGQGFAGEAAEAVLAYGFEVLGLRRVVAEVEAGNAVARTVADRLGMRPFRAGEDGPCQAVERDDWLAGYRRQEAV